MSNEESSQDVVSEDDELSATKLDLATVTTLINRPLPPETCFGLHHSAAHSSDLALKRSFCNVDMDHYNVDNAR